ncbi:peroxisomal membrane protein-domain-containing protein [Aspergillus floccosus]
MDTLSRFHASVTQAFETALETAYDQLKAELLRHEERAHKAEERAQLAEEARDTGSTEIESLRKEIETLREELNRRDTDIESMKTCQRLKERYSPQHLLSPPDNEDPSSRELDEKERAVLGSKYIELYDDAQILATTSGALRQRIKQHKQKLRDWNDRLLNEQFVITSNNGTIVKFKRVQCSTGGQRSTRQKLDHQITDGSLTPRLPSPKTRPVGDERMETPQIGYAPLQPAQTDLSELASTQSGSSPAGEQEAIERDTTADDDTRATGTLKRKRAIRQGHSGILDFGATRKVIEPIVIKSESLSSSPPRTFSGPIGTQDLDEVGDTVETPTKKKARGMIQLQDAPQSPTRSLNGRHPGNFKTPSKRSNILQPVDSNRPVHSQISDRSVGKSSEKPKKYAISALAEDGDENNIDFRGRKRSANPVSAYKPQTTTPETDNVSTKRRLDHLLEQPLPPRQPLLSKGKTKTKHNTVRVPDAALHGQETRNTVPTARPVHRSSSPEDQTSKFTHPLHEADPELLLVLPEEEPYRCRPLHRLELDHFKINPDYNQGLDYAFGEVVRKKDERKCLSGCMRPGCCGDKFRTMARLNYKTSPEEDRKILEEYLGDDKHLLDGLTEEEWKNYLEDAKARRLANSFGKHRHNHQRSSTPPGFWRTDMPDTQELEQDRQEAKKLEREKIKERYREAMRPGGMWKFADDYWYLDRCRTHALFEMESAWNTKNRVPPALWQPSKWLPMYEDFVTKNASTVGQVESALRSLTYIIPGRYRDSEISSECVHSGVQLLSLYHDSLVSKVISRLPPTVPRPTPTPHSRYTKYWSSKSSLYHRVALTLQMVQYTELLWEMIARRRGEKVRWRIVVLIEVVKAICRLFLLRLTNSRPLVSPPLPEREVDPRTTEEEESDWNGMQTPVSEGSSDLSWTMPRTGLSLPTLPDVNDVSNYLISKVLTADDIKPPKALLHRVTGQGQLAEVLYILRPVVYALALQRWSGDKRSWRPWLIGFGMEYGCRQLAKADFRERVAGGLRGLTGLEREELRKRGWAMGWWLMRGAFYESITQPWLKGLTGKMKGKPLLDLVGSVIEDYEYLWDNFYFPTATL